MPVHPEDIERTKRITRNHMLLVIRNALSKVNKRTAYNGKPASVRPKRIRTPEQRRARQNMKNWERRALAKWVNKLDHMLNQVEQPQGQSQERPVAPMPFRFSMGYVGSHQNRSPRDTFTENNSQAASLEDIHKIGTFILDAIQEAHTTYQSYGRRNGKLLRILKFALNNLARYMQSDSRREVQQIGWQFARIANESKLSPSLLILTRNQLNPKANNSLSPICKKTPTEHFSNPISNLYPLIPTLS